MVAPCILAACLAGAESATEAVVRRIPWRDAQTPLAFVDPAMARQVGPLLETIEPDGMPRTGDLERLMREMNEEIQRKVILPSGNVDAAETDPLAAGGWSLWVFWGFDAPEVQGLGSEMMRLRQSGLVAIKPVHLMSLRQWEGFFDMMNTYRERMFQASSKEQVQSTWLEWRQQWEAGQSMFDAMYRGGSVPLASHTAAAIALKVRSVPTFRLVSPAKRVHALDGFTPGASLVAWVERVQDWEAAQVQGVGR